MVTPTTTGSREEMVLDAASGFIYCVSRRGTTRAQEDISGDLREKVAAIRKRTDLPLAVDFGISTPEQVEKILSFADGAIVGSALVAAVERGNNPVEKLALAKEFVAGCKTRTGR